MDKVICVGKNYPDHVKEMGDAVPQKPVLFLKPPSVVIHCEKIGSRIEVKAPQNRGPLHFECEIVAKLNSKKQITALTLGLDMTLRDQQTILKKNGHPWEIAKVFPGSCLIGPWLSPSAEQLQKEFRLIVDTETRQRGLAQNMSLNLNDCIEHAAAHFIICEGDCLFSGTPAGVGPVNPGQVGSLYWGEELLFEVLWV
jgi:2-keto-4-pentenoate hydratase/2-oxohepta-3-ene-1,7-dioic acid hydratase in catechol pathway